MKYNGIIENKLRVIEEKVEMIRFRNFIVHRYDKIDLKIVFKIASKMLPRFNQFVEEIRRS